MTEHELTGEVIKLCDELGLLYHHCPRSDRCRGPRGFPDLLIAGQRGLIIAELKSEHGEQSAEQDLWEWTFHRQRSALFWLWRPTDLHRGTIRKALEAIK